MNDEKFILKAISLAKKASKKGDFPVGAIVVKNNKIISSSFNKKENKKNATYHAEILAIKKACKKLKTWRLDDCILYTSMEPCLMCYGAIIQSRIKKVVFSIANESFGAITLYKNSKIKYEIIHNEEYLKTIKQFFKLKRIQSKK